MSDCTLISAVSVCCHVVGMPAVTVATDHACFGSQWATMQQSSPLSSTWT